MFHAARQEYLINIILLIPGQAHDFIHYSWKYTFACKKKNIYKLIK